MTTTTQILDALLDYRLDSVGTRWNFPLAVGSNLAAPGGVGAAVSLTYSFPAALPGYDAGQGITDFAPLNAAQAAAARAVFAQYASVARITLTEGPTVATNHIAIGQYSSGFPAGSTGYAELPGYSYSFNGSNTILSVTETGNGLRGDVWIKTGSYADAAYQPGGFGYDLLLHEIGHAMGLKHPFEGSAVLPAELNHIGFTVMAYQAAPASKVVVVTGNSSAFGFTGTPLQPRTLMVGDMLALQAAYGANTATRTGDNTYTWALNEKFFETIWDAGGNDTIDASNQTLANIISLEPGTYSSIALRQTHAELYLDIPAFAAAAVAANPSFADPLLYSGLNNLGIAYGASIENANGGAGNDTLTGNALANVLRGNAGNDLLVGAGGLDTAVFSGNRAAYTITRNQPAGEFNVVGPDGSDRVAGIEQLRFADATTVLASLATDAGIVDGFSAYRYLDSNLDLLNFYGADTGGALTHFVSWGFNEGRGFTGFNVYLYLASNPDLLAFYGANIEAAAEHFARWGYGEGRPSTGFDAYRYLASNADLLGFYGANTAGATEHYVRWGLNEGRPLTSFDSGQYFANYTDLAAAFSNNTAQAAFHFVNWGRFEGRTDLKLVYLGTAGNDTLTGNATFNTLAGGLGNDTLTGGAGADSFVFNSALNGATNRDTVTDFVAGTDRILLDDAVFTNLVPGSLATGNFVKNAGGTAQDGNDFIVYNTTTGALSYDADGFGGQAAIAFATLTSLPNLTFADFSVV